MKICPVCDREFEDARDACPDDGSSLLIVRDRAAEQADAMRGKVIEGRYTIMEKLGAGGMGAVFAAEQTAVGRKVAIKVLGSEIASDKNAVKRFMQEARAASALSHPNTITIHDFGQTAEGELYLAMELVPGQTLGQVLRREGALPPERAVHIAHQILNALQEAHGAGIIHRDLKPENVIISPRSGNPDFLKVLDFGLAKLTDHDDGSHGLTQTGQVFGTPGYMAPEQAKGERCDHRADLYAVGVMLYEMLAGRRPFDGDNPLSVLVKHIQEAPPQFDAIDPPVEVDVRLRTAVFRALAKDRAQRFESAAAMNEALMQAVEEGGLPSGSFSAAAVSASRGAGASSKSLPPPSLSDVDPGLQKTLGSGIMGQVTSARIEPERGGRKGLWMAAAVVLLGAGAVAAWQGGLFGGQAAEPAPTAAAKPTPPPAKVAAPTPAPDAPAPAAAPDAAVAAPKPVTVFLLSEPSGAAVAVKVFTMTADGARELSDTRTVKQTPATLEVPAAAELEVAFTLDGHEPATVKKSAAEGAIVNAKLSAVAPPKPARPAARRWKPKAKPQTPAPTPDAPAAPPKRPIIDDLK